MTDRLDRREFLQGLSAAGLSAAGLSTAGMAALACGAPRVANAAEAEKDRGDGVRSSADSMILLWMAGGMASTETFDPKNYVPFEKGVESKRVLSTFPPIETAADGIRISEGLENIASVMDHASLIRTFTVPVVDKITHARHQYHFHTGYLPPLTVAAPHLCSWIARALGPRHPDLPAFIDIGETFAEAGREGKALRSSLSAGFLGSEYGPLLVPEADGAAKQLKSSLGRARHVNRMKYFKQLVNESPAGRLGTSYQQESMLRALEQAYRLMNSPAAAAFELSQEKKEVYDTYNTSPFGRGCLLARRLVEAGTRCVEVHIPYKPFGYWDTHDNGHTKTVKLKRMIDRPVAQLIRDLNERGLLERTLVVLASEFSRDVLVEGKVDKRARVGSAAIAETMPDLKHYGMHAHFADAGSILLFGGGVKKGFVYGTTADEHPARTVDRPVVMEDLHATILHALGIAPDLAYEIERRPFYVTRDGKGKPIDDLFASS